MIKLTVTEKKEIKAGAASVASKVASKFFEVATGVLTFTSLSNLILDFVIRYWGGGNSIPEAPARPSVYSPDSPAAHEQWLRMQEFQQKRTGPFH